MLIIIDHKMPPEAKNTLSSYGDLMELRTAGITYAAISGHPDIFFCQAPGILIVAPNLPAHYFKQLKNHNINFITGELPVGPEYPSSARYNAVATSKYLIHNFRHTDFMITRTLDDLHPIHVDQGYSRCNLLPLKDDHFITSDEGIFKVQSSKFKVQKFTRIQPSTFNLQHFFMFLRKTSFSRAFRTASSEVAAGSGKIKCSSMAAWTFIRKGRRSG